MVPFAVQHWHAQWYLKRRLDGKNETVDGIGLGLRNLGREKLRSFCLETLSIVAKQIQLPGLGVASDTEEPSR